MSSPQGSHRIAKLPSSPIRRRLCCRFLTRSQGLANEGLPTRCRPGGCGGEATPPNKCCNHLAVQGGNNWIICIIIKILVSPSVLVCLCTLLKRYNHFCDNVAAFVIQTLTTHLLEKRPNLSPVPGGLLTSFVALLWRYPSISWINTLQKNKLVDWIHYFLNFSPNVKKQMSIEKLGELSSSKKWWLGHFQFVGGAAVPVISSIVRPFRG